MILNTLWIDQSHGVYPDKIIEELRLKQYSQVVILGEFEWDIPILTRQFVDTLKIMGVKLIIIHGSFPCEYYYNRYNELGIEISNVIFWKTHFFSYAYNSLINFQPQQNTNIYPFICLNNRSHIHRCAMIDELSKRNYIDKGVVSWISHLDENSNYPYQYFDRSKKLTLGDNFENDLDSYNIPKQFFQSFLHIVTESTMTAPFITEKTIKPLLFKKPFLVSGSVNFNKHLKNLGFELYDEVFDYSFDDVLDLNERTSKIVDNLKNILDADLNQLNRQLQDKIDHNYYRLLEIIKNENFIPKIIKQRLALVKNKIIPELRIDQKYQQLTRFCHDT